MTSTWPKWTLLASCLLLATGTFSIAQSPASSGDSLETIGDNRLADELADRGLDSLLDRYFDLHHTPINEQKAIRSMEALRELNDPKLSGIDRQQKIRQIVDGIGVILPSLHDPLTLAKDAAALMEADVNREVTLLEYWGENPAAEARLRPVAEAVYKMLGQAASEARSQEDAIAAKVTQATQDTLGAKWEQFDNLAHNADYSQHMTAYAVALSLPPNQRAAVVDPAIQYLSQFDNPTSTVQARVRIMLAKLNLVKGNYDEAITALDSVADDKASPIQPPPTVDQQYEARYFALVAKLAAGRIKEAGDGLDTLNSWLKTAMPPDESTQKTVAANSQMLRYRILVAQAQQATDAVAQKRANEEAISVLQKLSRDRPNLRGMIYQQLAERMPRDEPVSGMDPLLLEGLMARAYDESKKPEGPGIDKTALQRGLDAAAEVLKRRGSAGVTPQMLDLAQRLTPILLEAMGNKIEAANAFLKYAQQYANLNPQAAQDMLEDAGRVTFELGRTSAEQPQVSDLYDRFLPIAIAPPFNRTSLAFLYAQRLRLQSRSQEAIKYYRMVPKTDKTYASGQYDMMLAMADQLANPKLEDTVRSTLAGELVGQAEKVRGVYAEATDGPSKERRAIATLTAAKARGAHQKQPRQTLQMLEGFEQTVEGTPDEKALDGDALLTRVNAYMALGQLKQATDTLVALLNRSGGAQGAEFVKGLLDRLDKDLDRAQAVHDARATRDIARSEADLSGFLVDWARKNPVPEIKGYTYRYMVFDARTKRLAGSLETDSAQRQKLLQEAIDAYKKLLEPENVKLYQATLDPAKVKSGDIDPTQPDPNVQLGIALTDYEMGNYQHASELLAELLSSGKLGGPTLLVPDPTSSEQKVIDNDIYWEATYKLYRANVQRAREPADASLDGTRQGLKNLLIRGGIPARWEQSFEDLRKQIIPEFDIAALTAATQPAAGPH